MLLSSIEPLIKQTSLLLKMPEDKVRHVVYFQFKVISDNYKNIRYVGFRLEDLGSLVLKPGGFRNMMRHLFIKLRKNRFPTEVKLFQSALKIRHQVYQYYKSKNYKERFGSWHH
jgi:hypothetical protein